MLTLLSKILMNENGETEKERLNRHVYTKISMKEKRNRISLESIKSRSNSIKHEKDQN